MGHRNSCLALVKTVADVILWRRKNLTVGILSVTLAVWMVFERSGYTLLSLVSSVFLLLIAILFSWAKSAAILNRYLQRFVLSKLYIESKLFEVISCGLSGLYNTD